MTRAHNIANRGFENDAAYTTRSFSKRGLSKRARRVKKLLNREAKRKDARIAKREEEKDN